MQKNKWIPIDNKMMKKLASEFYDLISLVYEPIGGHVKIKSPQDLIDEKEWTHYMAIDLDGDPYFDLVIIGAKTKYGIKNVAVGHDGSKKAKDEYLNNRIHISKKPGNYSEVSDKLADILIAKGIPIVDDEDTVRKVVNKPIEWIGSIPGREGNGWYKRQIGGKQFTKTLVGTPKL